ncbi:MAG: carboxypeptidase-like regulatory domain-containing protein [Gemmatimonadota bacterium]
MRKFVFTSAVLTAVVAAPGALTAQATASRPDTLLGRVTGDGTHPLDSVAVIVTRGPDRAIFRATPDADGRWQIVIDPGTGDYLVYVSRAGRVAQRRRVTRQTDERRFSVDVTLSPAAPQVLATVEVKATRREAPGRGPEPARGGSDYERDGVLAGVSPVAAGDPLALAGTVPGYLNTPGGLSALGLPSSQTLVTVNGLAGAISDIPRGLRTGTRVATSSYDVARGGFSGAQVDLELAPAGIFSTKQVVVAGDAPWLQATDAIGRALGQRFARLDVSVGTDGELGRRDRWTYSSGLTLRRTTDATPSLLTAPDIALGAFGLSRDTAQRLLDVLRQQGVPLGTLQGTMRQDAIMIGRVDRMSYDPATFADVPRAYGVLGYLKVAEAIGTGLGVSTTPSGAATGRTVTGALQLHHSLKTATWLHDSRTSASLVRGRTTPALLAPIGTVRATALDAASGGLVSVGFGGNDGLAGDRTQLTWDVQHTSKTFTSGSRRQRLTLFAQGRVDATRERAAPGGLGRFTYNSIDDVALGRPASFSRVLTQPERAGGAWNAALGAGSVYRRSALFSMQYGARVEAGGFLVRPDANPGIASVLGVRTDVAPVDVAVLPRVGFRWVYGRKPQDGGETSYSMVGTQSNEVRGVLRGGVGLFRQFVDPDPVARAAAAAGLPGSLRRLVCGGAAVPTPDGDGFVNAPGTIPESCVGPLLPLDQPALAVRALAPDWRAPRSWRGNLAWSTRVLGTDVTVEGVASLNLSQTSLRDLNFAGIAGGALSREGDRPLFVPASVVVPSTGAIAPLASRRDATWGPAMLMGSDGRSVSTQLRVQLTPPTPLGWTLRTNYVLGRVRERFNGFDRNTAGDPRAFEWAAGDLDVRHQVQLQAGWLRRRVSASVFADLTSGRPFTPLVSGDVNGDGLSFNDRAFVTGAAGEPATVAALDALTRGASPRVRECLSMARGMIAPRNGCRGPWQARLNLMVGVSLPGRGAFQPSQLQLFIENPLAGLDQALHGNALRGWGTAPEPDPVLLAVRGFDAGARRFEYDVNPRFGATDPRFTTIRAPFRVTLNLSIPFGASLPQQQLSRALRPGRNGLPGPRPDSATLHKRYARNVPDVIGNVLEERDSLLLTAEQVTRLEGVQRTFRQRADSLWGTLASEFARYGDTYDAKAALARQEAVIDAVWEVARQAAATLSDILTPVQYPLVPNPADWMRTAKPGIKIRYFTG